jgi:predicted DCC family thiol-disulfide oxidoreductase YuxK
LTRSFLALRFISAPRSENNRPTPGQVDVMATPSNSSDPSLTVYFDGSCPVCAAEIGHYRRQAGAQACVWIDAASCADAELGPGLPRDAALRRFHVRRADGRLVDGMRGFAALWATLPQYAWLGRFASFGPMPAILEPAYRLFLAVRPLWRRPTQRADSQPSS